MTAIRHLLVSAALLLFASSVHGAEPAAKQFLRYVYGADGIELSTVCLPAEDAWMLRGAKNPDALAELDKLQIAAKDSGVTSGVIGRDFYVVETRNGKVDPAFNLDSIHVLHRQIVLHFIFAALTHDDAALEGLATDAEKVKIVGPEATDGDMDQYEQILSLLPVVRSSKPIDDAKSRTVTYRIPLGEEVLSLTLRKDGSNWKIDTSRAVRVPVKFFFQ